jgi:hypothetical protein
MRADPAEDVRPKPPGNLLGQGIMVRRQQSTIQDSRKILNPCVTEMVKDARIHTSPFMNRHESFLTADD